MTATATIRHSRQYSLSSSMDSTADKEERKREYNRLAQREFRRRRKEHLKNLEQAQKEQNSEQSEEIERLRYQNDELRRENEALRAQLYGPSSAASLQGYMLTPVNGPISNDGRSYSLSPSISGASISGTGSPPASMGLMSELSLTSSMIPSSMQAYSDPTGPQTQPYSMVHSSGLRQNSHSSPESSGFRNHPQPSMGSSFQSLNVPSPAESAQRAPGHARSNSRPNSSMVMVPYDRNRAKNQIRELFHPLLSDPSVLANPERHLAVLASISDTLPSVLKPSKAQLETHHHYGIDLIASPALRDRLLSLTRDVAQSFISDFGSIIGEAEDVGQIIIWGEDPLNEISWEVSQQLLERWGWLLGKEFIGRCNWWRRQRGAPPLPHW